MNFVCPPLHVLLGLPVEESNRDRKLSWCILKCTLSAKLTWFYESFPFHTLTNCRKTPQFQCKWDCVHAISYMNAHRHSVHTHTQTHTLFVCRHANILHPTKSTENEYVKYRNSNVLLFYHNWSDFAKTFYYPCVDKMACINTAVSNVTVFWSAGKDGLCVIRKALTKR